MIFTLLSAVKSFDCFASLLVVLSQINWALVKHPDINKYTLLEAFTHVV